ncbi:MAG: hypothetical protein LUQ67_00600 [Methanomicrobiales archaeon]|nr:hypothetical protein [Methanomicrobiales archaeon]
MDPLVSIVGLFFVLEGVANIIYWRNDNHPWYFQAGRVVRVILGAVLIMLSL